MEQIIKTFLSLFFLLIVTFAGVGLISVSVKAKNADTYLNTIASQWEASNFTLSEEELLSGAGVDKDVYSLKLTALPRKGSFGSVGYAAAELSYHYEVPVLGLSEDRTIVRSMR